MSDQNKTIVVKGKKLYMNAEASYLQLLASNAKKVSAERVMSFEKSSVPLSIFQDDATMMPVTNKCTFLEKLKGHIPDRRITTVHHVNAIILDGHAVIKALLAPSATIAHTFKDIATEFV